MTYNVHACIGMDGRLSPRRIARVIAQADADIVALQELDVGRSRTGGRDQAHEIARYLRMEHHFHAAFEIAEERYGDAVLSRFPLSVVQTFALPSAKANYEPRGAQWLELSSAQFGPVQILNTHLSIIPRERLLQAQALVAELVGPASLRGPTVLCGDFNAIPGSPTYRTLESRLIDAPHAWCTSARQRINSDGSRAVSLGPARGQPQPASTGAAGTDELSQAANRANRQPGKQRRATRTWFSPFPLARIDHVFVTPEWHVDQTMVIQSQLARAASDHLPLVVDLYLPR